MFCSLFTHPHSCTYCVCVCVRACGCECEANNNTNSFILENYSKMYLLNVYAQHA